MEKWDKEPKSDFRDDVVCSVNVLLANYFLLVDDKARKECADYKVQSDVLSDGRH